MNWGDAAMLIAAASKMLSLYDESLLRSEVYERALVHRFAVYFEQAFRLSFPQGLNDLPHSKFRVDAEYSLIDEVPKEAFEGPEGSQEAELFRELRLARKLNEERVDAGILPDCILHKRGSNGPNIMVMEFKKGTSPAPADRVKLRMFASGLCLGIKYEHSVFIGFKCGKSYSAEGELASVLRFKSDGHDDPEDKTSEVNNLLSSIQAWTPWFIANRDYGEY